MPDAAALLPDGCIVTMITPFAANGEIDYDAVDALGVLRARGPSHKNYFSHPCSTP